MPEPTTTAVQDPPITNPDQTTTQTKTEPTSAQSGEQPTLLGTDPETPPPADPTADAADEGKQENLGAPEKYELKPPEGMTLDEAQFQAFEPVFRKHNLSQEAVQEIVDLYAGQRKAETEAASTAIKTQADAWGKDLAAHPDLGGKNLAETTRVALSAMSRFGSDDLRFLLNGTGLGNHPVVVEFFHKVGKAMAEDGNFATGRIKGAGAKEDQPFYKDMNP